MKKITYSQFFLSTRETITLLFLWIFIAAGPAAIATPLPADNSTPIQNGTKAKPAFLDPGSEINPLQNIVQTDQAVIALRRALAAMATRQWSGGWGEGWNITGQVVWGEFRPIPYHWLTVQPPATPTIAQIYVRAFEVLDDDRYLHHARLAQKALLAVQSDLGGFPHDAAPASGRSRAGTFDDDVTTGALAFFIDLWHATGDEADRQAVLSVGEFLLVSQYPESGGWPQAYPPRPDHYQRHITFNDQAMTNAIKSLLRLYELFGDDRYLEAARRGGECIIRLQGPAGEEIWAQQYDPETLLPAPARAFEPAGYTAGESRSVIEALIELYLATGDEQFLEPLPKAFGWYDKNRLPNGNWARYYEPGTGIPIYGDRDGKVYYRLEDISLERQSGYSWEGDYYPYAAKQAYDRILEVGRDAYLSERRQNHPVKQSALASDVRDVIGSQHPDGWWTEKAARSRDQNTLSEAGVKEEHWDLIWAGTFVRNTTLLLDYIEADADFYSDSSSSISESGDDSNASLTIRTQDGLRQALAAMTTRQWTGGWANASTLDGLIVQGQGRPPMPHYWLTVQPPATPATARVYIRAAKVLNDDIYLHHARMAKRALLAVQTKDGGFPDEAAPSAEPARAGTFDDDATTGALHFLMELWQATGDEAARQAVLSVGEFLLISQYPGSGGWPQVYPPRPDHYQRHITFNDRAMANVIESLLRLYELTGDNRYLDAARFGGECIIRLQGPAGEEVWAQQYDPETLLPAPARAFEPAAYTAGESRSVIEALIELYLTTGEERFLEPIPKAFAWYDAKRLPNGNWARYYEPGTGRPIYGDRDGKVYYRLEDISLERQRGYSWEGDYYPYAAKRAYDRIVEVGRTAYLAERQQNRRVDLNSLAPVVREILESQHPDGWWVDTVVGVGFFETGAVRNAMMEAGEPEETWEMIRSGTFARNANLLLDFIEAGQ